MNKTIVWAIHINRFLKLPNSNQKAYCARYRLNYRIFRYWLKKLHPDPNASPQKQCGALLPLVVQNPAASKPSPTRLSCNNVDIFLEPEFNTELLKKIIYVLKEL